MLLQDKVLVIYLWHIYYSLESNNILLVNHEVLWDFLKNSLSPNVRFIHFFEFLFLQTIFDSCQGCIYLLMVVYNPFFYLFKDCSWLFFDLIKGFLSTKGICPCILVSFLILNLEVKYYQHFYLSNLSLV